GKNGSGDLPASPGEGPAVASRRDFQLRARCELSGFSLKICKEFPELDEAICAMGSRIDKTQFEHMTSAFGWMATEKLLPLASHGMLRPTAERDSSVQTGASNHAIRTD